MKRSVLYATLLALLSACSLVADNTKQPNILLIVVDDLGYADLSCVPGGAPDVLTPNMDRLAKEGTRFTQAYVTAPICNASRIALMTGRYQQRQGTRWYSGRGLHRPEFGTIAETLKAAGYTTGFVGKFHHGSEDHANGRGFPLNHGFDTLYGFSGGTKHYLHHATKHAGKKDRLSQGPMWVQREKLDAVGLSTELFGEEARKFLRANQDQPFYLHLSFNAVHNYTYQLPRSYLDEKGLKGFRDLKPNENLWEWRDGISYPNHPEGRDYYLGQLHFLDREIGRVLDELKRLKLADNTAVFLISDNGGSLVTYANNTPLKGGKYTLFEGGIRVPLLARLPHGEARGRVATINAPVSSLDLFPTFCDLAGAPKPHDLDGVSLLPLLRDPRARITREDFYWETGHEAAIRRGKWKLLITRRAPYPKIQITDTPTGTQLFDLEKDPGERRDVAAEHPVLVAELAAAIQSWKPDASSPSDRPAISISGVYPHLTMRNNERECGTGALVPWADRLWAITYAPHMPGGSSDKLYEITPDLKQIIRPESVGGTPANRLIHRESNQLLIGPYVIDAQRNVRVIPPTRMFGRLTANARHLTDPANKVYYATMEEGLYEVDVNTLDVTCFIRDGNNGTPKVGLQSQLPGYHGKGMYSGQGRVVYANNGERHKDIARDPTITSGALAQWFGTGDWQLVRRNQFTEITGPDGILGSARPDETPIWALGWDARSVILALLENRQWHFYRLPKGSHSYDGSHGWNTEWPRIREIGERDLLATMHGTFWRFPATFSKGNSAGIAPRSNYLKVIGDFCRWQHRIVLGCDDSASAEFLNTRDFKARHAAPKQSNSNLWFVEPEKLDQLGPVIGRGSVWLRDDVAVGQISDPYLFSGYQQRQLHLTHQSDQSVTFVLELDLRGTDEWTVLRELTVPAGGAVSHLFAASEKAAWIRIRSRHAARSVTANFQFRNHDRRDNRNASVFAGIATPDRPARTFGLMRSLAHDKLGLVAATATDGGDAGYYELDQQMRLSPVEDPDTQRQLVRDVAQPARAFTVDEASVVIVEDGKRYRLPKNDSYRTTPTRKPASGGKTAAEVLEKHLARNATVTVSSTHDSYPAAAAVDGGLDDDSRWIGRSGSGGNWIELDLGKATTFRSVWVVTGWKHESRYVAQEFDVQIKAGDTWRTLAGGAVRDNRKVRCELVLPEPVTARHVRVSTTSDNYFRVYEIALFADPPAIAEASPAAEFSLARVCREVATERDLLNLHGTFYELPARNAQGLAKVRPIATHNLAIHDFCSHNGLLLFTGLDAATRSDRIFRSADGKAAVWAGVVDDLWQLGKPRGHGGPWNDTSVKAGEPSDPYLMTAYDQKRVTLTADLDTSITLEVDIDGTGIWIPYRTFSLTAGKQVAHEFPAGFSAYWVRAVSDQDTKATVLFDYN